jgi:hypothetical protein
MGPDGPICGQVEIRLGPSTGHSALRDKYSVPFELSPLNTADFKAVTGPRGRRSQQWLDVNNHDRLLVVLRTNPFRARHFAQSREISYSGPVLSGNQPS